MRWQGLTLYDPIYGAYTELFAAVSPDITLENSGSFLHPWGRLGEYRQDLAKAMKPTEEGGLGLSAKFIAWCNRSTAPYA